ncbi:MAG: DNA gyrase subunit B [Candidatus Pacebacteria bacterium]|nr:DNA gyrase subunit B [Candidatus Paceibacterota bacterium]
MAKDPEKTAKTSSYGAESITVLEGLDPVRKRPGMYIGSTGPDGLHHLIKEIFDNSRDEAMAGHADHIEVALLPDGLVRIVDNGRGIPVDIHSKTKVSALETILTVLHAGGKFGGEGSGYKVSGGLHGVGSSVVNALSIHMRAEIHKDGQVWMQEYSQGKPKAKVKPIGKTKDHGSVIEFIPDIEIFKEVKFLAPRIIDYLREQAYLSSKLRVVFVDAREFTGKIDLVGKTYMMAEGFDVPSSTFYFEGGLVSMVRYLNKYQKPVQEKIFHIEKEIDDVMVEVAVQYVDDIGTKIIPFANHIYQSEGGQHVTGFKTALTRLLNNYNKEKKVLKDGETFSGDDVLEGLTAIVSVKMPEIQFEGQTKAKLGSVEARGATETVFGEAFALFLEENPDEAKAIMNKAVLALRARKAAKAAKDSILRKGALEGFTLPGKLADCQIKDAESTEVFIVEGDSAGGTSKQGRDRRTQAILPLRGKILNVERARIDRMVASQEIRNLVIAMGTSIGETFDLSKIRYHKIIIATDADVDGAHIRTLLLTLFYRYFRPIIDAGYIYIAQPPLYKVKKGKEVAYAFSDNEKIQLIKKMGGDVISGEEVGEDGEDEEIEKKSNNKIQVQRYKGLGEMNAEELWETTMDPERRVLKQVKVEDAIEADRTFDILMGSEVAPRKLFIQTNAKMVELDI